jgi:ketosteroid isomerase-like protein
VDIFSMTDSNTDAPANAIVQMFTWWNGAFRAADGFTPEAFARFYTDDGALIVNGNLRGRGPAALAAHYKRLQEAFDIIQMELPVIDEFNCGNRAFVHCVTVATKGGSTHREEAMATATLQNGRIAVLQVLGRPLP